VLKCSAHCVIAEKQVVRRLGGKRCFSNCFGSTRRVAPLVPY
jgi:hypothetical protein